MGNSLSESAVENRETDRQTEIETNTERGWSVRNSLSEAYVFVFFSPDVILYG